TIENELGCKGHAKDLVDPVGRTLLRRYASRRVDALYVSHLLELARAIRLGSQQQPVHGVTARSRIVANDGADQAAAVDMFERIVGTMVGHDLSAPIAQFGFGKPEYPVI